MATAAPKTAAAPAPKAAPKATPAPAPRAQDGAARDIGIEVPAPKKSCSDPACPFHGHLKVRGQQIVGTVRSTRMVGTVVVEKEHLHYDRKFERYERRTRRYAAHLPGCFTVAAGDEVRLMECRPISKTVAFVVVEHRGGGAQ